MAAWKKDQGLAGSDLIEFAADTNATLTDALGARCGVDAWWRLDTKPPAFPAAIRGLRPLPIRPRPAFPQPLMTKARPYLLSFAQAFSSRARRRPTPTSRALRLPAGRKRPARFRLRTAPARPDGVAPKKARLASAGPEAPPEPLARFAVTSAACLAPPPRRGFPAFRLPPPGTRAPRARRRSSRAARTTCSATTPSGASARRSTSSTARQRPSNTRSPPARRSAPL